MQGPAKSWPLLLLQSVALSVVVAFVSANLNARFQHREETIGQQTALLRGEPYFLDGVKTDWSPFYCRVFFPALLKVMDEVSPLPIQQDYLLLRLGTAVAAFLAFQVVVAGVSGTSSALIAALLLALGLIPTFNHGWEIPIDFPDVFFVSLAILFVRSRRFWPLVALTVVATTNHQTAAFNGVLWGVVNGWSPPFGIRWKEALKAGALVAVSFLVVGLVRWSVRGQFTAPLGANGILTIRDVKEFLAHPTPFSWPFLLAGMFVPSLAILWLKKGLLAREEVKVGVASLVVLLLSLPIVYLSELRSAFLTPLVLVTYLAGIAVGREAGGREGA